MKKTQIVFFILGGFFITNALIAEFIGGKLFTFPMPDFLFAFFQSVFGRESAYFVMPVGILPWPIVFVATDIINEFFGKKGVRFYTFVTVGLIIYSFFMLGLARFVDAASFSPVSDEAFDAVFGTSQWIIVGSIVAFLVSQLVDVLVFSRLRRWTGKRHLWMRATGSTIVSQLIDTFIIQYIAFVLPGKISWAEFFEVAAISYLFKVGVAILITPLCYLGHGAIFAYLGKKEAQELIQGAHSEN